MGKTKMAAWLVFILLATLLVLNITITADNSSPADVQGNWAQTEIEKMLDRKIFKISNGENFNPDEAITRGEFADVLATLFNQKAEASNVYEDVSNSHKYSSSITAIKNAGFIPAEMVSGNKFYPQAEITAAEAKAMLDIAFIYAYKTNVPANLCTVTAKSGAVVAPTGTLTKAQTAVIAYNLFYIEEGYPDVAYRCKNMPGTYENSELSEEVDDAYLRGARKVIMQPGTYYLYGQATRMKNAGRNTHFGLAEVNDFILEGYDVNFIACTPSDGTTGTSKDRCVMVFRECENLTVRGFTTDFKDIIYTQAEVVKIEEANNANYITIVVDEGYPNQLDNREYFTASLTGYIYDPVTKLPKERGSVTNLSPEKVEGEERMWRCQNWNPSTMKFFEVGDMVVFRMNACGPTNTAIQYCRNFTLEDYTVYSGHMGILDEPSMLRENGESDNVLFRNVRVTFGPRPEGATRDRLVTTYADALRFAYISGHVTVENCIIEGATDDLLSFHARHYMVTDLGENENELYIGTPSYGVVMRAGDNFAFYDESSNLKGTAKVLSVEDVTNSYTPQPDAADINGYGLTTFHKVTLEENDIGVNRLDYAFDIDASSGGFVVKDSIFRNSTGRGCLVQAWNGLFENNTYENLSAGLELIGEKHCAQGPYAKDIVIRNCSFKGCSRFADVKSGLFMPRASILTAIEETGLANRNFVIDGCYFEDNYGEDIHIGNTRNAILSNNIFGGRNEFMDSYTVRGEASINISSSDQVYLNEGNVALTNRLFATYADVNNMMSNVEPVYSSELKTSVNNSEGEEWTFGYSPVGTNDYYNYNHQYWSSGTWVKVIPLWSQDTDNNREYGYNSSQFEWIPGSENDIVITYTAPYSGKVKVKFNDGLKIKEGKYNSNGVNIKVLKGDDENVWPTMGWYKLPYGKHVRYIEDIYVNVQKGDKIRFRINANGEIGTVHDVVMICPEICYVTQTYENTDAVITGLKLDTQYKAVYGTGTESAFKISANKNDVMWSSSSEHVATVSSDGTVTPKNAGVSIITASCNGEKADCIISVRPINGIGIEFEKRFVSAGIGETVQLPVILKGNATLNGAVWQSSDTDVADVDENGIVTVKSTGSAVISVITDDYSAGFTVIGNSNKKTLVLNKTYAELQFPSETLQLEINTIPLNAITWESSNTEIATVDGNGLVTPVSAGTVVITATVGTKSVNCTVHIKNEVAEGIKLNKEYLIGKQDDTFLLSVKFAEGVDSSEIVWSSSNENVATVDENGLVRIVLQNNRNTAVITATTKSGETASCNVFVHNNYYKTISTNTHFVGGKNDSDQLLQYMYSRDDGQTFLPYSLFTGGAWLDDGAVTGRVQNWRIQGKADVWATVAFKAPYTGTLGIYYNGGCSADSDADFKIKKNDKKIYPIGMDSISVKKGSDEIREYITEAGTTVLCLPKLTLENPTEYKEKWAEGVKVDVKAGDYIYLMAKGGNMIAYTRGFEFKYDSYETIKDEMFKISKLNDGAVTVIAKPGAAEKARVYVAVKDMNNNIIDVRVSEEKTIDKIKATVFDFTDIAQNANQSAYIYIWDSLKPLNDVEKI